MTRTDYKIDWLAYSYPEDNMMSSDGDIAEKFRGIDLSADRFSSGGIPLLVKGSTAYVNPENENTVIFGETGSKKTRCAILPLIAATAGARESAFITDVKGELSANKKLHNYLEKCGIKTVYLDFRNFFGDGYNILEQPFRMYRDGEPDRANAMIRRLVNALNQRYEGSKADPFWGLSAVQYLVPMIQLILAHCSRNEELYDTVNMLSVNAFVSDSAVRDVYSAIEDGYISELIGENSCMMLKSVLGNPDKTLACIISTVQSIIQDFTLQKDLLNMLSDTTFDVGAMYEQPTFVFLIVPDETSTYDTISGIMTDLFYNQLIETYNKIYQGKSESPCRINYICDEFCNMRINDMRSKISASRSRNMRWFLVCQSERQLDSVYPEDAGTIIGNCKNILFLQSSDTDLLDRMSDLCGKSGICEGSEKKPLVSRNMLKSMKKECGFKEALYVRDDIKYFAILPDIDAYEFLMQYDEVGAYTFERRFGSDLKMLEPDEIRESAHVYRYEKRWEEACTAPSGDHDDDDCGYDDCDFGEDEDEDDIDDATCEPEEKEIPGYIAPVSGTLTAEEASLNSDSDVLPQEAMETVTRRLMSLFAADDTTDDGQEDDS